jgi:hypothetical protein
VRRLLLILLLCRSVLAVEWIALTPNPSYSRDLALGASTIALAYPPQSESINAAGLTLFDSRSHRFGTLTLNPLAPLQIAHYRHAEADGRRHLEQVAETARLLVNSVAYRNSYLTLALLMSRPVMSPDSPATYDDYPRHSSLASHQNSIVGVLHLHRRVSLGGRIDRYYGYSYPRGDGYSYGVILRPRGMAIGVQYQRYPGSGIRVWHPFDRRDDGTTAAGLAWNRGDATFCAQVMNLTQPDRRAYLEPHAGIEWRPVRALALRAGGMLYSRSPRWSWTGGVSLLDANWFRPRAARLLVPDEVIQAAVAVQYRHRVPELGLFSLSCAWRW